MNCHLGPGGGVTQKKLEVPMWPEVRKNAKMRDARVGFRGLGVGTGSSLLA